MTTDQLQQKHLEAIGRIETRVPTPIENVDVTAKQCALITIEHTIGVLEEIRFSDSDIAPEGFAVSRKMLTLNEKIDSKISELKKQKEQL
jgi:hypothetical protein